MNIFGWLIVAIPLVGILGLAIHSKKYVRGVSDFLACGRVCTRYVISVGGLEEALSVITLVALIQQEMHTGFAFGFWNSAYAPIGIFLSLVGFCTYRFRETKSLSLGQFLEMRYSRRLRFIASIIRVIAEMITNSIGPAVAVRFFIYFLGISPYMTICGMTFPTFWLLIVVVIIACLIVILAGGQISLVITDCCQALMSYPIFVIFSVFVLTKFSWSADIMPVLLDRMPGESFVDPYDVQNLRDFNLFLIFVTILQSIFYRANWLFGLNTAAKTAHEGKMGTLLGTWRQGFSTLSITLLAIAVITFMNSPHFAESARNVRQELGTKLAADLIADPVVRAKVTEHAKHIKPYIHDFEKSKHDPAEKFSQTRNPEMFYLNEVRGIIVDTMAPKNDDVETRHLKEGEALDTYSKFKSFYSQMVGPVALKHMMPPALIGLMTLLMAMLMLSTDDSRIFNSSVGIVQDIIIPLHKRPLSPRAHFWYLRAAVVFVGIVFIVGSLYLTQLEYLKMFMMIMAGLWNAGASPAMIGGFYIRFGTTYGAYASLITGLFTTLGSIIVRTFWADTIYPWLYENDWVDDVGEALNTISGPFDPIIVWKMDKATCPINAIEFTFIAMFLSWAAYLLVSKLTCRKPFNLERMLHRGIYADDPKKNLRTAWSFKTVWNKLIGITPEYTKWDRVLAWSVFLYSIIYSFGILFVAVVIWNSFKHWSLEWWGHYYWAKAVIVPICIGVITTVWFLIGGVLGLRQLFRDLSARVEDPLDNGQVADDGVAIADQEKFKQLETTSTAKRRKTK